MNRLIIIGNGFDLAHGFKTKYYDFAEWYLKKCFTSFVENGFYSSSLLTLQCAINGLPQGYIRTESANILQQLIGPNCIPSDNIQSQYIELRLSPFLNKIITSCNVKGWVDIENEYYSDVMTILANNGYHHLGYDINQLNQHLQELITELEIYLSSINTRPKTEWLYESIFTGPFYRNDFKHMLQSESEKPNRVFILNFNYTETPGYYMSQNGSHQIIYIHGKLNRSDNPLIFGFGDEVDDKYQAMERTVNNNYFKYMKTFWYLLTTNYKKLLSFIGDGAYEVRLLGHSCGLSDRTLLSTVFEHKNCVSVRPYYHGTSEKNDYTEISHNLSRHFADKKRLRQVVVPRSECLPMPQER